MAEKDQSKPDKTILKGGPTESTPPDGSQQAPTLVKVKYGGQELSVTPEIASAWEAREKEFGQKLGEHSNELGELRKVKTRFEELERTIKPPEQRKPDLGTLLFENPNQALTILREDITKEVQQKYMQDQSQREFWRAFYRKHDDLDGEDTLVQAVMQRHWGELQALPVSDAQDKIADFTRSEILRIHKKLKGGKDDELPQDRAVMEGVSAPASRRRQEPEDEGPKSLSEVIRARRQSRLHPVAKG